MTEKGKSRIESAILSFIVATCSALIVWGFSVSDVKRVSFKSDIEKLKMEKANRCDVDIQIKDLENRTDKKIEHNYNVIDKKLDLIIKLIDK